MKIIYVNLSHVNANAGRGAGKPLLPVICVDDLSINGKKDCYGVKIGDKTRVVYDKEGHWRGPRVWIETEDEVIIEDAPMV